MKLTAVEWLVECLNLDETSPNYNKFTIEKAKEMEKQQIIEAHGTQLKKSRGVTNYEYWLNGEEYYNETFKSE
jgi:hypothetical protein